MIRSLLLAAGFAVSVVAISWVRAEAQREGREEKEEMKATVDLFASLDDSHFKGIAENGLIVSQKAGKLAKAWGIKGQPRSISTGFHSWEQLPAAS